jgi:plastocyanin
MNLLVRRTVLRGGGALFAAACFGRSSFGAGTAAIHMRGDVSGSKVWFDPVGLHVELGQQVTWTNMDAGNSHTATAYHPNAERQLRIPVEAQPWNSEYLLPNESFSCRLSVEGVYDYFCIPHEHAGMVGRIVVGRAAMDDGPYRDDENEALKRLPSVREIIASGQVRHTD